MSSSKLNLATGYLEWMEAGYCKQSDPELWHSETPEGTVKAKNLCLAHCDPAIVEKCLKFAMDTEQQWGVWGGTSPGDRTKLRGGTDACAKNHPGSPPEPVTRANGERRCAACQRVHMNASREKAAA